MRLARRTAPLTGAGAPVRGRGPLDGRGTAPPPLRTPPAAASSARAMGTPRYLTAGPTTQRSSSAWRCGSRRKGCGVSGQRSASASGRVVPANAGTPGMREALIT